MLPSLTYFKNLPNWKELRRILRNPYGAVQTKSTTDSCHLPQHCHTSYCPEKMFQQSSKWTNNGKSPVSSQKSKDSVFSSVSAFPALDENLQGKKHQAPLPPLFSLPFLAPFAVFIGSKALQHIPVVVHVNKYKGKKNQTNNLWGAWTTASLPG